MDQDSRNALRPITTAETWPLRQSVLRPGRPLAAAQFTGDDLPSTKHFGAFQSGELVGIASLFIADMPEHPGVGALQLRGMATAPAVRGAGFGRALVTACVAFTLASEKQLIWCNARRSAVEFYRKLGWEILGEEFDVPDAGPHFHMWRRVA